jgi:hypothetical protein
VCDGVTQNALCYPYASRGQTCSVDGQCTKTAGTKCINFICDCPTGTTFDTVQCTSTTTGPVTTSSFYFSLEAIFKLGSISGLGNFFINFCFSLFVSNLMGLIHYLEKNFIVSKLFTVFMFYYWTKSSVPQPTHL